MKFALLDVPSLICQRLEPGEVTIHESEITVRVEAIQKVQALALPLVCYNAGYDSDYGEFRYIAVDEYNNILNLLAYRQLYDQDTRTYHIVQAWVCDSEQEALQVVRQYEIVSGDKDSEDSDPFDVSF